MTYSEKFKEAVDHIRKFSGIPSRLDIIQKTIEDNAASAHNAQERNQQQQEIRQKWFDKVFTEYEQTKGDRKTEDNRQYAVQNSLRWAAWLTFFAAAIYGFITLFLWLNAREQLEMDQRSWLVFDTNYADKMELGGNGANIVAPFRLVNIGKTPARKIEGFVMVEEVNKGQHPTFVKIANRLTPISIGILYPGSEYAHTTYVGEFADDHKAVSVDKTKQREFESGDVVFNVWGRLKYVDIFRDEHWVQFCHAITDEPWGKTKECADYNLIDPPLGRWAIFKSVFAK